MFRDIAAGKPGTITHVGLETYVDPRIEGGKVNKKTTEELVEVVRFDDQDYLRYKHFDIDVCLIRGTTADEFGNISMEQEGLKVIREGKAKKFVKKVEQVTFSGNYARKKGTEVFYVSERCVLKLGEKGLHLIEIAPGIDMQKDVIDLMDFKPIIETQPKLMNPRIFMDRPMEVKD